MFASLIQYRYAGGCGSRPGRGRGCHRRRGRSRGARLAFTYLFVPRAKAEAKQTREFHTDG